MWNGPPPVLLSPRLLPALPELMGGRSDGDGTLKKYMQFLRVLGRRKGETMDVVTFDVGGTSVKYGLMHNDELIAQGKVPTPQGPDATQEEFLSALDGVIEKLREVAGDELDGVAMSLPGTIDVDRRYLKTGGALMYNYDTDVNAWAERWGLPVEIENDARCATIAEYDQGNLKGSQTGVVLAFGTGIGGGIIINGEVYKGVHLYAGEASMIYLTTPTECSHTSGASFSDACSTISFTKHMAKAKGLDECSGEHALELVRAGDADAVAVFDTYLDNVAREIHNIQCLLDPDTICLGGGISQDPFFVEQVREAVRHFNEDLLPFPFPMPKIVACRFFNDANLVGAYGHFVRMQAKRRVEASEAALGEGQA